MAGVFQGSEEVIEWFGASVHFIFGNGGFMAGLCVMLALLGAFWILLND